MNTPYFFRITVYICCLLLIYTRGFSQEENASARLYHSHQLTQANLIPENTKTSAYALTGNKANYTFEAVSLEKGREDAFVSFGIRTEKNENYEYRYLSPSSSWSSWTSLEEFHESDPDEPDFVSEQVFLETEVSAIQLRMPQTNPISISAIQLDVFYPGTKTKATAPQRISSQDDCDCALPEYVDRVGWGSPDGNDPSCPNIAYVPVTHMIVHHTVNDNSLTDWEAVVWSIWNFHVNTRGWCDLGYNWLIDPNGVLYEGRGGGDDVRGAHFCGKNGATMGVAMLGTFTDSPPTEDALNTLKGLLAWKSCKSNISPISNSLHASSNLVLPHISGHRQGCATECPGDSMFIKLQSIREDVKTITTECLLTTSIQKVDEEEWGVYPNPFDGEFQLTLPVEFRSGTLSITDMHGKLLWQSKIQSSEAVKLPGQLWAKGVYLLRLSGKNFFETRKLLKN